MAFGRDDRALPLSGKERILGIDEAGRGAVIGPLVICGAVCRADQSDELVRIGTKDSKLYTRKGREQAAERIGEVLESSVLVVYSPAEIDSAVRCRQLNVLEATGMAKIVNSVQPEVAYIDALGRMSPRRYTSGHGIRGFHQLLRELVCTKTRLIIEYDADERYPIVSAASVLAKVARDRLIRDLSEKYGEPVGSGYSDRKTLDFIVRYYQAHRCFPDDMRMNWKTRRKLLSLLTQKKLDDFPIERRSCRGEGE
jgi:ribonuclease HII